MKKIFSFIVLLAGVAMFTACGDDDATFTATPKLEVTDANVLFEADGGTGFVTVNSSSAVTATIPAECDWLTLSVSGNKVTITAATNASLNGRSAKIVLKADGAESSVTATQKGSIYGLVGGYEYSVADTANARVNIPVVHSIAVNVESLADWLQASFDDANSEIVVTAASNDDINPRTGLVAFSTGSVQDTVMITQKGMIFNIEAEDTTVTNAATKVAIKIQHSKPVVVESKTEWITVTTSDKNGVMTLTLNVAANESGIRKGAVSVKSGQVETMISVSQYDFAQEVMGSYMLVYYDTSKNSWYYYNAVMDAEKLSFDLPVSATMSLTYEIPVNIDANKRVILAGPCSSFVGMYSSYYIYLVFRSAQGYWSGYTNTTALAEGKMSVEEEQDGDSTETVVYVDWGGTFGSYDIDAWALRAMKAEGFSEANNAGYLASLFYPYMIKVPAAGAPARAAAKNGVHYFRGHKVYPASQNEFRVVSE